MWHGEKRDRVADKFAMRRIVKAARRIDGGRMRESKKGSDALKGVEDESIGRAARQGRTAAYRP